MLVHLPKDFRYCSDPIFLPERDPYLALQPIPKGFLLHSTGGKLVGQSFFDKKSATIAVGDAKSYRVELKKDLLITPVVADEKALRYEPFGEVQKGVYSIYEYSPGSVRPLLAARITDDPDDPDFFYANLAEECNVFRMLLFVSTVAQLTVGKKRK